MIKKVIFVSQREAEEIVPPSTMDMAIISITDTEENLANLKPGWKNVYRFAFYDIKCKDFQYEGRIFKGMSFRQAKQIIKLTKDLKEDRGEWYIIVHCHAGISRSAAIAKYIAKISGTSFPKDYHLYNEYIYDLLEKSQYMDDDPEGIENYKKWLEKMRIEYEQQRKIR